MAVLSLGYSAGTLVEKKAKKERGLDEVHDHIWLRARSYSWYATIIAIYIFFTIYLFGYEMSLAMVLALLIFIQLASWAFSGMILSAKLYSENESTSYLGLIGFIIVLLSFILFFTLAIITENWIYLIGLFLFGAIGGFLIVKGNKNLEN